MRRYVFVRVSLKRRDGNTRDLSRWGRDERAPRPRAPQRGPRTSFEDVTSLERPIHLGLELPEQVDRDVVVEREDLREEDATDALGAVDPEVGVCEPGPRSEEHTSELQSHSDLVCRFPLGKKHHTPHA